MKYHVCSCGISNLGESGTLIQMPHGDMRIKQELTADKKKVKKYPLAKHMLNTIRGIESSYCGSSTVVACRSFPACVQYPTRVSEIQ